MLGPSVRTCSFGKKMTRPKAEPPLALHAVTDGDTRRLASHLRAQRPATAMSDPGHEILPFGAVRYHKRYVMLAAIG